MPGLTFALHAGNPVLAQASGRLRLYGVYVVPAASGMSGSLTVAITTTGAAGDLAGSSLLVQAALLGTGLLELNLFCRKQA